MQKLQDREQILLIEDKITKQQLQTEQPLQNENQVLTIQQMAQATGVSTHTLRYYERAGLMYPVERNKTSGHRTYTWQHINWIQFIKCLRATGMPIRDIQRYAKLVLQGEQTAPERMQLLKKHQERVEANLQEVRQHLTAINTKIALYQSNICQLATNNLNQPLQHRD